VVRRDLARRRRDPVGLLVMLAIPLGLLMVFRFAFGTVSEERSPRATLLVVDADSSLVSRFLSGAFSQGGLTKIVDAQAADSATAMRQLKREKASGALFIPKGFGDDFLAARPTKLVLYKNPSERILPSILEEVLATMADGGGALQSLLAGPMRRISGMTGGTDSPAETEVAGISVDVQRAITRSGKYLLPPVIELKPEVATKSKGGPSFMELFFPGLAFMAVVFLSQSIALDTAEERRRGTLRRSLAMGVNPGHLFLGKVLAGMVVIIPTLAVVFLLGRWLVGTPMSRLLVGWGFSCFAAFTALAMLFALALIPRTVTAAQVTSNLVVMPMCLLGGCFFPIEVMPSFMQGISKHLPTGWAIERMKDLILAREGGMAFLPAAGVCLVVGAVFLFVAHRLAPRRFMEA
jgi:ABC-2 type transport system permease protein